MVYDDCEPEPIEHVNHSMILCSLNLLYCPEGRAIHFASSGRETVLESEHKNPLIELCLKQHPSAPEENAVVPKLVSSEIQTFAKEN